MEVNLLDTFGDFKIGETNFILERFRSIKFNNSFIIISPNFIDRAIGRKILNDDIFSNDEVSDLKKILKILQDDSKSKRIVVNYISRYSYFVEFKSIFFKDLTPKQVKLILELQSRFADEVKDLYKENSTSLQFFMHGLGAGNLKNFINAEYDFDYEYDIRKIGLYLSWKGLKAKKGASSLYDFLSELKLEKNSVRTIVEGCSMGNTAAKRFIEKACGDEETWMNLSETTLCYTMIAGNNPCINPGKINVSSDVLSKLKLLKVEDSIEYYDYIHSKGSIEKFKHNQSINSTSVGKYKNRSDMSDTVFCNK